MRRNTPTLNKSSQYLFGKIFALRGFRIQLKGQEVCDLGLDRFFTSSKGVGRLQDDLSELGSTDREDVGSTLFVFKAELQDVHDLLYRSTQKATAVIVPANGGTFDLHVRFACVELGR